MADQGHAWRASMSVDDRIKISTHVMGKLQQYYPNIPRAVRTGLSTPAARLILYTFVPRCGFCGAVYPFVVAVRIAVESPLE